MSKYLVLVIVKSIGFRKHYFTCNGRGLRILLFRKAMVTQRVLGNGFWRVRVGSGGWGCFGLLKGWKQSLDEKDKPGDDTEYFLAVH
jgi:hypothetical protein